MVIYRHGDGLVKIFEDNKIIKYNLKFKQKIIDATGCGDAFNAAFLISYFNKKNLENCVRSAHKLGKKVALTKGAIIKR